MTGITFLLRLGSLLLAAGAILLLAISHCQQGDGWSRRRWRWRQGEVAAETGAVKSPLRGPWCSIPGCTDCVKATEEMQQLLLLAGADTSTAAIPDAKLWQAAWRALAQLVERGYLSCCDCSSSSFSDRFSDCLCESCSGCESLRDTCMSQAGEPLREMRSPFSIGPTHVHRVHSALRMHVARKTLEVQLGVLPLPVQRSRERVAQRQGHRVLPELIQPGQRQPLLQHKPSPWTQLKADTTVDSKNGAPPALPSLGSRAAGPGTRSASILPREDVIAQGSSATQGGCQDTTEHGSWAHAGAPIISSLVQGQELCSTLSMLIERKYLDIKHQRLPVAVQRSIEMVHRNLPTLGWAEVGDRPLGPCSAAPALLQLNDPLHPDQDTLQQPGAFFPCPVASTALCTCLAPVPVYGSMHREERGQASLQASSLLSTSSSCSHQLGRVTTGGILRTPSAVPNALSGQAFPLLMSLLNPGLAATEPRPECGQGAQLWVPYGAFGAPAPAAPQGHWGCSTSEAITASRCFGDGTSAVPSEETCPEGPRAHKPPGARPGCWSSGRQFPCSSESFCGWGTWSQVTSRSTVISRSTDTAKTLTPVGFPEANPTQESVPTPTMVPSSPEGTLRQHSLSQQQHCRVPPTRHKCSCHLHPAQKDRGSGTALCSLLEKVMCQRRRNLSPSPQSSNSQHCDHVGQGQGCSCSNSSSK